MTLALILIGAAIVIYVFLTVYTLRHPAMGFNELFDFAQSVATGQPLPRIAWWRNRVLIVNVLARLAKWMFIIGLVLLVIAVI